MIYIFDSLIAHVNAKYPTDSVIRDYIEQCIDAHKRQVYDLESNIEGLDYDIYMLEKDAPDPLVEDILAEVETISSDIVQKHRCKEAWESDALNLLYKLANKVV